MLQLRVYPISGFGRSDEAHRFYIELGYEVTGCRFVKKVSSHHDQASSIIEDR
ncbi:hypothetical protein [Paenibacillus mendelii]|uniref:Glyoxalase n=1 Tax=Paenibacillus mendelii TaxID=206163 RepID=A0ABV6JI21_9BACL|nr:hypothetical protein [Paenibacillus mendelii]MCQ6557355.1 hypothetical protein [Paenibacillus mendelii]